jgi:RNA polymerase sigma-70 factor, ECF subfamily
VGVEHVVAEPAGLPVELGREGLADGVAAHAGWSLDWAGWFPATRIGSVDDLTQLAQAAATGDRLALAAFVRRTQPEVWRVCARLGDRDDADDLTQEVFVRAIPALSRFRADASARTWLLQIARHVCSDHVRRRTRRRALMDRLVQRAGYGEKGESSRSGLVELDELVHALPLERREAFVLTQVAGLSYAEAAEACEVPVGTIRSRVARARGDLLDALTDERDAGSSSS